MESHPRDDVLGVALQRVCRDEDTLEDPFAFGVVPRAEGKSRCSTSATVEIVPIPGSAKSTGAGTHRRSRGARSLPPGSGPPSSRTQITSSSTRASVSRTSAWVREHVR